MAGGGPDDGSTYSPPVAAVYIFNLIVGAGALAMPQAFSEAGYIGGCVLISVLAFMSYITVTHIVEAMSIANAFIKRDAKEKVLSQTVQSVELPLLTEQDNHDLFAISVRTEMGQMSEMFFSKMGLRLFYLVIVIYLYGDLCIYAVAVPKSLKQTICGNITHIHAPGDNNCMGHLDPDHAYYVFLTAFAVLLGPFCFFNVQKTKIIQLVTTFFRWFTFITMITIAVMGIASGKGFTPEDKIPSPSTVKAFNGNGLSVLFGVAIYSFMCHHSLPSLLTPMTQKAQYTSTVFAVDFLLILGFYCLLSFTAVFRFDGHVLSDLYTLNFVDFKVKFISYFLALFPVFVLSANFPIIAITLRNNLHLLFQRPGRTYPKWVDKLLFPILAIGPPIIVAFFTDDVQFLVGITGSYAGVGIQYVIPALLCFYGRRKMMKSTGFEDSVQHHRSWFGHPYWIYFVCGWSLLCIGVVTYTHIATKS